MATAFNHRYMGAKTPIATALTNEELFVKAPSIFAPEAHDSRSAKYTYIPTIDIVEGLRKEGFMPFSVVQSKSRIEGKEAFTKHMIRFREISDIVKKEWEEMILINSHDGTSSYKMMAGLYRQVCSNGMVAGEGIADITIQHRGNIIDNVVEAAYTIRDSFDVITGSMDNMKSLDLKPAEAQIFARAALALKYDEDKSPIAASRLLQTRRWEDQEDKSIWTNFNVVQENLIRGGQQGRAANGNRASTRAVNSIDGDVKLNKALWILANEMAALKA